MSSFEMEALNAPRTPSPCSMSPSAGEVEDTVSLPSTDSDDEITHAPSSEPRTLVAQSTRSSENVNHGREKKCHTRTSKQELKIAGGRGPIEEPKLVWTKNRKRALRYFLFLHFVPVAITISLFWLYLEGFQWRASDIQLKMLLFVAKLHESLILISLADILFHRIRYQLLTGRGISFGLLVSPFRVASPFSIFQTPFWASAKFTLKSGPELVTILLVVLVSVLALLAAPSSGVLMLPKYGWWQIPKDAAAMVNFTRLGLGTATYIRVPFDDLFPSLIDESFSPDLARDDGLDPVTLSNRFEQLISGLDRVLIDGSFRGNANITVVDGATVDAFGLAYQEETSNLDDCEYNTCQYFAKAQNTTVGDLTAGCSWLDDPSIDPYCNCINVICQSVAVQATSPLALITSKLFDRYRTWTPDSSSMDMITAHALDAQEGVRSWRQPSVSTQCSTVPYYSPNELQFQQFGSFAPFSIFPDRQLLDQIQDMKTQNKSHATYTDISRLVPSDVTISTAFLMHGSREGPRVNNATYLCLVDARWIDSNVWYTGPYASIMRSGTSMESLRTNTGSNTTLETNPVMHITPEYANSLDTNLTIVSSYMSRWDDPDHLLPFEFIQRYCHTRVASGLQPKCAMLAHALYLTDSLRRLQSSLGYQTEVSNTEGSTLEQAKYTTKLDYRVYHQLHAYKFEGSIIKLSMSVLLVHMMLVYAHLLLLVLGEGWYSRAWSELGELMALAILTQPSPLLRNSGGGVDKWQTWRLRTFVREVTPEGRLELILKETGASPRDLLVDDESREKLLVEPEADRRYG